MNYPFHGTHTALVTPLKDGAFDEAAFRQLIASQFEAGVTGIVPVGTTGESPTLTHEEHEKVVAVAVEAAAGRPVMAGTGSNSTSEAISLTRAAEKAGAGAALLVAPYYNKPSQEGLFQHFSAIAREVSIPLMLYSIPGRCGIEIGVETTARLHAEFPHICAIKEAGGSCERVSQLRAKLPEAFEIMSGDDSLTVPFMSVGASGVVSVASNLIPGVMSDLTRAMREGDLKTATGLHTAYYPLFSGFLKLETNPVPIKTALALTGALSGEVRLPLVAMNDEKTETLRRILSDLKLV
ncbi:MAG: 4-hydroxy-tetrahydrodipicolinate synthase [Verrucomicrobiota bacterium]